MLQGICYRRYSTSHLRPQTWKTDAVFILKLDHAAIQCNCGMQGLIEFTVQLC